MEFTTNLQLYKPRKTDTKQSTLDELANNADKIESELKGNYMNVKWFGAKGDGTSSPDDTTAIQNAFNYARDNGSVRLYFPKGTYLVSGSIQVYKNTTVYFHPGATIKRNGTYAKLFANGPVGNMTYASGYNGDGNIHFHGGIFDLNTSPSSPGTGLFDLAHGENISFDGIKIINGGQSHGFQVSSCKNVRFSNCYFGAVTWTDTTNADHEFIQIEVATSSSFPAFGGYDLTISRDIFIENCTFDNVIRAVGNHSDGKYGTGSVIYCENIKFINNKIFNSQDDAIHLTGYRYSTIKDNLVTNTGNYGLYMYNCDDNQIEGNIIVGTLKDAFHLDTINNNRSARNTLKEVCTSATTTYSAIRMYSSTGNTFNDDTVTAITPNYGYAFYESDGTTGTKIKNSNFTKGKTATTKDLDGNHIERVTGLQLGTAAPTTIPDFKGQEYLDTTNRKVYKAINTTASTDWLLLN